MSQQTQADLRRTLGRIDGRGYKSYKDIQGRYAFPEFELFIDYVQGDPFASPSQLRVRVPQRVAQYPANTYSKDSRRIALESYLARQFSRAARRASTHSGSGKSGLIDIDAPGQELLERTAVTVTDKWVEARFIVGLPAQGRRVMGRTATTLLCADLPKIVLATLRYKNNNAKHIDQYVAIGEDAAYLRDALSAAGLVAFVATGSILPRRSGVDDRVLNSKDAVAFKSPASLQCSFTLPNFGKVVGMGIPAGVTLIVGGGFHGKSTLLNALERGVYNHVPGDGREFVVTNPHAVKIRAEDGRSVAGVNISPFISNLPHGRDTTQFSTENASGSTSQAANIMEALELGAEVLLIDEDTAATNFMIRDQRMQALISKDNEPITPFIDKVRQLYDEHGVSTILVIGGSGDYFDVADVVVGMEAYVPRDLTAAAKAIATEHTIGRRQEGGATFGTITPRIPHTDSLDASKGRREVSIKTRGLHTVQFGEETIDLSAVAQLVDSSQTRALADALQYAKARYMNGQRPIRELLDLVMADIEREGLDVLGGRTPNGSYAAFRKYELGAALNRLRALKAQP